MIQTPLKHKLFHNKKAKCLSQIRGSAVIKVIDEFLIITYVPNNYGPTLHNTKTWFKCLYSTLEPQIAAHPELVMNVCYLQGPNTTGPSHKPITSHFWSVGDAALITWGCWKGLAGATAASMEGPPLQPYVRSVTSPVMWVLNRVLDCPNFPLERDSHTPSHTHTPPPAAAPYKVKLSQPSAVDHRRREKTPHIQMIKESYFRLNLIGPFVVLIKVLNHLNFRIQLKNTENCCRACIFHLLLMTFSGTFKSDQSVKKLATATNHRAPRSNLHCQQHFSKNVSEANPTRTWWTNTQPG